MYSRTMPSLDIPHLLHKYVYLHKATVDLICAESKPALCGKLDQKLESDYFLFPSLQMVLVAFVHIWSPGMIVLLPGAHNGELQHPVVSTDYKKEMMPLGTSPTPDSC